MKYLLTICLFLTLSLNVSLAQTTLVVNSTGDDIDNNLGDGVCDTGNLLVDGITAECTLRAAIGDLKDTPDPLGNTIDFTIPATDPNHAAGVWTISPATVFPTIDFSVDISTRQQSGYFCPAEPSFNTISVVIDGSATAAGSDGFILSGNSYQELDGFGIVNFPRDGVAVSGTARKFIRCNNIGILPDGSTVAGNRHGIRFANFTDSTVVARNLISGNTGVGISHAIQFGTDETWFITNYIGTNAAGTEARGNAGSGIAFFGTKAAFVGVAPPFTWDGDGGASPRNVISGNGGSGIAFGATGGSANNSIVANHIGVGESFSTMIGNGGHGMILGNGHDNNLIDNNTISGNTRRGISIGASDFNTVSNNRIGTDFNGADNGNGEEGVHIGFQADDNTFTNNDIAFNTIGIYMISGAANLNRGFRNKIQGNRIYSNDGLGIDIAPEGLNANDADDADEGSNNNQNSPDITNVGLNFFQGGNLDITYNVDSAPANTNYPIDVEFYLSDSSGDEAAELIGTDTYTEADYNSLALAGGSKTVTFAPGFSVSSTDFIGASAIDALGNTSEFSVTQADVSLPVELVNFDAVFIDDQLQLSWSTLSEENNSGFDVQFRASRDDSWTSLAWIDGQVNSDREQSYQFDVQGIRYATGVVRLRQLDLDGSAAFTPVLEIRNELPAGEVIIQSYPNPVLSTLSVDLLAKGSARESILVRLFDLTGKEVKNLYDGELADQVTRLNVDLSDLPAGVYSMRVEGMGRQWVRPVVVL